MMVSFVVYNEVLYYAISVKLMSNNFSPIQNHVLSKLKNAKSLRYSELVPEYRIQNDLFNYHLQFLVKKGFVEKLGKVGESEGYALSEMGIKHVADPVLFTDEKIVSVFKVNVITIVSRAVDGKIEILNQVRNSHPSFGKKGVPGGIIWKGEEMLEAGKRKLKEETGLEADFKLLGIERRILKVKGELFSDVFFPILYSDSYSGELESTEFGENMWVSIEKAIENESDPFDSIEMITTVLNAVKEESLGSLQFLYKETIREGDVRP